MTILPIGLSSNSACCALFSLSFCGSGASSPSLSHGERGHTHPVGVQTGSVTGLGQRPDRRRSWHGPTQGDPVFATSTAAVSLRPGAGSVLSSPRPQHRQSRRWDMRCSLWRWDCATHHGRPGLMVWACCSSTLPRFLYGWAVLGDQPSLARGEDRGSIPGDSLETHDTHTHTLGCVHGAPVRGCGLHPAMSTVALPPVVTPEGHCCPRFWLAAAPCTAGRVSLSLSPSEITPQTALHRAYSP